MGNCQAIDAAALVIQHPDGRIDRLYWPVTACDVMKVNPGHYVSLIIPLQPESSSSSSAENIIGVEKTVKFTRVKLLRPTDTLALGHAYRLITSQEVMKVLRAKKYAKTNRQQPEESGVTKTEKQSSDGSKSVEQSNQGIKREKQSIRAVPKTWRPSLQSISEAAS